MVLSLHNALVRVGVLNNRTYLITLLHHSDNFSSGRVDCGKLSPTFSFVKLIVDKHLKKVNLLELIIDIELITTNTVWATGYKPFLIAAHSLQSGNPLQLQRLQEVY